MNKENLSKIVHCKKVQQNIRNEPLLSKQTDASLEILQYNARKSNKQLNTVEHGLF